VCSFTIGIGQNAIRLYGLSRTGQTGPRQRHALDRQKIMRTVRRPICGERGIAISQTGWRSAAVGDFAGGQCMPTSRHCVAAAQPGSILLMPRLNRL
jgi:hypothetical protein